MAVEIEIARIENGDGSAVADLIVGQQLHQVRAFVTDTVADDQRCRNGIGAGRFVEQHGAFIEDGSAGVRIGICARQGELPRAGLGEAARAIQNVTECQDVVGEDLDKGVSRGKSKIPGHQVCAIEAGECSLKCDGLGNHDAIFQSQLRPR